MKFSKFLPQRQSLALKFLYLLIAYLTILVVLPLLSFNAQFGIGWDALLQSPTGSHVDSVADAINEQLQASPSTSWNGILKNFGGIYQVKYYLFDGNGEQLGGDPIILPPTLAQKIHMMPPFQKHRQPPPGALFRELPPHWRPPDIEQERRPGTASGPNKEFQVRPEFGPDFGSNRSPDFGPPHDFRDRPPEPVNNEFLKAHGRFLVHTNNPDIFWIGTRMMLFSPERGHPIPATLLAESDNIWQSSLLVDLKAALLVPLVILLLSLCFWLPFIYQITAALTELTRATESIAEGHFDTKINSNRHDEIGRLAEAVNSMADRINTFLTGQKRLMGDISHELCSPIARLQMALELLESSSTPEQQSLLQDIREEVVEMNNLVNELLAFSKAELKGPMKNLVAVPLKPLFENLIVRLSLTEVVALQVADNLAPLADHMLLERAVGNMLRNSVRYGGGERISLTALRQGDEVVITIADQGPGVPAESLKHLGEPFFRPEASRSRSFGGAGLGLAIVKSCVTACQGTMVIRNRAPHGLEIEIRLKAAS
jgi:two-component system sensor histidine kinase CpxA